MIFSVHASFIQIKKRTFNEIEKVFSRGRTTLEVMIYHTVHSEIVILERYVVYFKLEILLEVTGTID